MSSDPVTGALADLLAGLDPSNGARGAARLLDALDVALCAADAAGRLTYYNRAAAALWGWSPPLHAQLWCGSWRLLTADGSHLPHDRSPAAMCLRDGRGTPGARTIAERPDGTRVVFAAFPSPLRNASGEVVGVVNLLVEAAGPARAAARAVQDVLRPRTADPASAPGFALFEAVRDAAGPLRDFTLCFADPAAARLLGCGEAVMVGRRLTEFLPHHAAGRDGLVALCAAALEEAKPRIGEWPGGQAGEGGLPACWIGVQAMPLGNHVALRFGDVATSRMEEARASLLDGRDVLTRLLSRGRFLEILSDSLDAAGEGMSTVLLLLDLDRFRSVNDSLGPAAGDALLRHAAARIQGVTRAGDQVARLGGDDFAILMAPGAHFAAAASLAGRLCRALGEPFALEGRSVTIGASVGIAIAPSDGRRVEELLGSADLAMLRAQGEGGGRFARFVPGMEAEARTSLRTEAELRAALRTEDLEVHYQPILEVSGRRVTGMEALVRWRHLSRGLVPPGVFIPLAERVGLIDAIGDFVLRQACTDALLWPLPLLLAVNVSASQLRKPGFADRVARVLAETGLPPDRLEIEITETALVERGAAAQSELLRLRGLGVHVALDDFGTGYSSLACVRTFPISRVKIDRSFVRDLDTRRDSAAIVRAVSGLCADLGIAVTAEGVETEAELRRLRAERCTEVQGYLFSPPRPAPEIPALIARLNGRPAAA
ncbi:MAG TPA: EAL domain-containing protein [Acetobacteraceae bacterium]|nr:EAL domain-containing protein [Acetobacteraceae bacterium]